MSQFWGSSFYISCISPLQSDPFYDDMKERKHAFWCTLTGFYNLMDFFCASCTVQIEQVKSQSDSREIDGIVFYLLVE